MSLSKILLSLIAVLGVAGVGGVFATQPGPESNPLSADEANERLAAITSHFDETALASPAKIVPCTLSGGTQTSCVSITVRKAPERDDLGPWCPRNIKDSAEEGGIWLHEGEVHDVDGAFIENLATFYNDDQWQMFDPATGKINVTDTQVACEAAARPDVEEQYQNHCVECETAYLEDGATATFVIPLRPVMKGRVGGRLSRSGAGVTLTGLRLDGPAPVDAILSAHTLAAFDDCGGHVNMAVGYHVHAVTDCHDIPHEANGHAAMIGVALDGFAIHGRLNEDGAEPRDLDACRGHEVEGIGYHYHAGAPGDNQILGCHAAEIGCYQNGSATECDASGGVLGRLRGLIAG